MVRAEFIRAVVVTFAAMIHGPIAAFPVPEFILAQPFIWEIEDRDLDDN